MSVCPFCENAFPRIQTAYGRGELHTCSECHNPIVLTSEKGVQHAEPLAGAIDIREDSPPESVGGAILDRFAAEDYRLPLMPEMASHLKPGQNKEDDAVPAAVSSDPVVAARILEAANGELFGGLSRATTLEEAAQRLGAGRMRSEFKEISKGRSLRLANPLVADAATAAWHNSLFTAHCARAIGKATSAPNPEALFLAGLLHDLGKFFLFDVIETSTGDAVKAVSNSEKLFEETIARFHPLAGLHLAERWRFPAEIATAIFAHHDPSAVPDDCFAYTVTVVRLANAIAHATGYGKTPDVPVSLLAHPANRQLHLSDVRIATIRIDLSDQLTELLWELDMPTVAPIA